MTLPTQAYRARVAPMPVDHFSFSLAGVPRTRKGKGEVILKAMRAELDELNQSAVASLDEGFEETLTLHRLGVFPLVGRSLKTTNVLESVNAQAEQRCGRVDRWRN